MADSRPWSVRFLKGTLTASGPIYYVPAGYRAIVRSLSVTTGGAAGIGVYLDIQGTSIWAWKTPGGFASQVYETRQVAYAGEFIRLAADAAGVGGYLSGYLLADAGGVANEPTQLPALEPPPFPPEPFGATPVPT